MGSGSPAQGVGEEVGEYVDGVVHVLLPVVEVHVPGAVDPVNLLGPGGPLERFDAHPRGDGAGADDHEQWTSADQRHRGEGIERGHPVDA